jgi:hypothetical protein
LGGQGLRQVPVALGAQRRQNGLAFTCAQGQEMAPSTRPKSVR